MKTKILYEITNFCKECSSHNCCPEEDCVLFRIEKLVLKEKNNKKKRRKKRENNMMILRK